MFATFHGYCLSTHLLVSSLLFVWAQHNWFLFVNFAFSFYNLLLLSCPLIDLFSINPFLFYFSTFSYFSFQHLPLPHDPPYPYVINDSFPLFLPLSFFASFLQVTYFQRFCAISFSLYFYSYFHIILFPPASCTHT